MYKHEVRATRFLEPAWRLTVQMGMTDVLDSACVVEEVFQSVSRYRTRIENSDETIDA